MSAFRRALACVVLGAAVLLAPATAHAAAFSVLVFSKTAGFRHDSIPAGIAAIQALGTANNFTVVATEDATAFNDANLANFATVVFLSTTGDVLDANQQAAFERFIRAGKGFVGIHAAADTEYGWAWYGNLTGAYGKSWYTALGHDDVNSYWESPNNAFPQSITVDLQASYTLTSVVMRVPPSWGARSQTLSILGSANGSTFNTVVGSAAYTFPAGGSITVTLPAGSTARYLRLTFTANTGWPAGQLSDLQIIGTV